MIPVTVQTLIVSAAPSPSIIVLQPVEEIVQEGKSRIIPIWVGVNEATQMGIALEKARFSRPMTHDLFLDALTNLDAQIDHVVINDVQGATFFARLTLRQHDRLIDLDARARATRWRWPCGRKLPSISRRMCWSVLRSPMC